MFIDVFVVQSMVNLITVYIL